MIAYFLFFAMGFFYGMVFGAGSYMSDFWWAVSIFATGLSLKYIIDKIHSLPTHKKGSEEE